MKKLLFNLASKLEPSIIQNILLRLSSSTPKMFKLLQVYSVGLAAILGVIMEVLTNHEIPDFKYENLVIMALKGIALVIAGAGASMSLHTTDSAIHNQSNAPEFGPQPE